MGTYTTAALVKANYKRFAAGGQSITDQQIESFIAQVDGVIEGILYKIYDVPLLNISGAAYVPGVIKTIAVEMATAKCLKFYYESNQIEENQSVRNTWNDNLEMLQGMVKNKPDMLLPCKFRDGVRFNDTGNFEFNQNLTNDGSTFWSTAMDENGNGIQPIFDLDDWTNSKVSTTKLDELSERRGY